MRNQQSANFINKFLSKMNPVDIDLNVPYSQDFNVIDREFGTRTTRFVYVDYLKIMAILGVVMSHSLATPLASGSITPSWYVVNVLLTLVSPSVGIFFMVSGALILSSTHTNQLGYILKHRILKVGISFVIWSGITVFLFGISSNSGFKPWLKTMLSMYHQYPAIAFWFMYPLIGFYLLSLMLKVFVDKANIHILDYIILLWLVTNMLLPFLVEILPSNIGSFLNFSKDFNLIILGKTIGYFLIGYRLHKTPIRNKSILGDVLLVMLLASIIAVTNILNNLHYSNFPVIGYNSIISLIFSIEIFWLFKKWSTFHRISPKLEQITTLLSSLTFGIYLTHGAVMIYVHKIIQPNDYLLVFFLTVGLSFILTYTISKIPKLRYFLIGIE